MPTLGCSISRVDLLLAIGERPSAVSLFTQAAVARVYLTMLTEDA